MEFNECTKSPYICIYTTLFLLHAGIVVHYIFVSVFLLWLLHVTSLFYAIVFPFSARKTLSKYKHVYLIPTFIGKLRMHIYFISWYFLISCFYIHIRCKSGVLLNSANIGIMCGAEVWTRTFNVFRVQRENARNYSIGETMRFAL